MSLPEWTAIDLGNDVHIELVLIQPGTFMMGPDEADKSQEQFHKVTLTRPFYLGKFLVTQEQWDAVMGSNPSQFRGPKLPVENVDWDYCQTFLSKLSAKTGRKFTMPTEAHWEYACRAGTTNRFSFGDDAAQLDYYAWYVDNSKLTTHAVGEKLRNPWGLYDMYGNVHEWCADWLSPLKADATDPQGPPASGTSHMVRGGSYEDTPAGFGSGNTALAAILGMSQVMVGNNNPTVRMPAIGLRCEMSISDDSPRH